MTPTDEEREFMVFAKRGIEGGYIKRPLEAPEWSRWTQRKFKRAWRRKRRQTK